MLISIRNFRPGEESLLRAIFFSSVHELACRDYSTEQLDAWAPVEHDNQAWRERIFTNRPFVAELVAEVSLTAEPFFAKNGFVLALRQQVLIRGVSLSNALMKKAL